MKKNRLISYSIVLLASLVIMGCTTSDRIDDTPPIQSDTQDEIPNTGGFINDTNTTDIAQGSIADDENSTTGTIKIDAKNAFKVSVSFSDTYNEKGYYSKEEIGLVNFDIKNIYTNEAIDTNKITSIVLEAEETVSPTQGKYFNFITYKGEEGPKYEIPQSSVKATDKVALKMKDLSGTTNLIMSVNIDGFEDPFKLKVPLVIEKNKSSSMAIVPIGSRYENGLFIDKFVIHVVDSYGNKAQDGTHISTGVINNPKLYSNAYNGAIKQQANSYMISINTYENNSEEQTFTVTNVDDQTFPTGNNGIINYDWGIYKTKTYTPQRDENGTVLKDENNNTLYSYKIESNYYDTVMVNQKKEHRGNLNKTTGLFTLNDNADKISSDITDKDTLIILANKENHKPENLGGWDIQSVNADNELTLVSLDSAEQNIEDVSYVIGDEYRYIDQSQTIANGAVSTFETTEVKDGLAYAELRYTPEMVGHNVFIYANTRLEDKHIGISRKLLLHGTGLSQETLTCTNDKGLKPDCSRSIRIVQNGSGEGAYKVNIARPQIAGEDTYRYATATQTDAQGWTTVSIYGIDENKTATVTFGDLIFDEYIINQK